MPGQKVTIQAIRRAVPTCPECGGARYNVVPTVTAGTQMLNYVKCRDCGEDILAAFRSTISAKQQARPSNDE